MSNDHPARGLPARGGRPRSSRGRKKEEEILEAAARIFHEKGYAATSIRDIADAVGLLKGSLYYYVPSKEELLYKIIVAVHEGALENLRRAAETEGSPRDRLLALIRGHLRNFGDNIVMIRVFYVDFTHLSGDRHQHILGERDQYEEFVADLIQAGQREGFFAPDLDPRVAAIGVLTMLNSVHVWFRPEGRLSMAEIESEYERLILRGLAPVVGSGDGLPISDGAERPDDPTPPRRRGGSRVTAERAPARPSVPGSAGRGRRNR